MLLSVCLSLLYRPSPKSDVEILHESFVVGKSSDGIKTQKEAQLKRAYSRMVLKLLMTFMSL